MKKSILKNVAILTFALFGLGIIGNNVLYAITSPIEVGVDEIWTHNYCRCHGEECKGGNAISFRRSCAKSEEPIQCPDYSVNC